MIRIGHGFDVHRFKDGDHIMLGGVRIEHDRAFVAHSDGDVLLHAICDALLGALALGDIGRHFPDSDPRFLGADSSQLLQTVVCMMDSRGWRVGNLDCTILAQAPKMAPHIDAMRAHVAQLLQVGEEQVNVKATTTESLGYVGRHEGIAAHAVVVLGRQ